MEALKKVVVFDLDGTLVDSNRDLIPALNYTIAMDGVPPVEMADIGGVVGKGAIMMIRRAFELHGHTVTKDRETRLLPHFLAYYEDHIADHTVYFDGALEAMDRLATEGWAFAVCTNKYEHLAKKLVAELGTSDRFVSITGGDTFNIKKPDGGHILKTVESAGGDPELAIMVGDSINDIDAAKAACIPVVAVNFGYTDVPVEQLSPDVTISHFDELPDVVRNLRAIPVE